MFYADNNLFGQCKPILIGKHSLCNPPSNNRFDYTITNFNSLFIYSASVLLSTSGTTTTTSISITTPTFTAFIYSPTITNARIIVTASNGTCVDADTIFVQTCCTPGDPSNNVLTDITVSQIPNIVQVGSSYFYNPNLYPLQSSTIVINGLLDINATLEISNCLLLVDQGGEIKVRTGNALAMDNVDATAGCGIMWKGINCENGTSIKVRNSSTISDAQYAIKFTGTVEGDFDNPTNVRTQLFRNFISIYAPDNIAGNNFNFLPVSAGSGGLSIDGAGNLLPPFYGQLPLPQQRGFAGIYLKDVASFTNIFSGANAIRLQVSNLNIGIASIRGSMTLDNNVSIFNIAPLFNLGAQAYNFASAYNGSAVYCEGTTSTPQTVTFGNSANTGLLINSINNCRYGVNAFRNVNVNCVNNNIDNVTNLGGVRVDNFNIGGRTINIVNNRFQQRFFCAVFLRRLNSANLVINGNTFNTGAYYPVNTNPSLGDLGNVAIRIAAVSPTALTGSISGNVFTSARIGIYASNIRGRSSDPIDLFKINNNVMNMDRGLGNYFDLVNPTLAFRHLGIWLENSRNLDVVENNIVRANSLNGAPNGFEEYLIGIRVQNMMGASVLLRNNTITRCGTGIKFSGFCFGTSVYCNTITSDPLVTFPRGLFFDNAGLSNQGANCNPFANTYTAFSSSGIAYKVSGVLSTRMQWFGPGSITPFSVTPVIPNFFNIVATNCTPFPSICGEVSNEGLFAMYDRVHQIVYDEITYEENPEESRYLDLVFAYNAILNDSVLQTMDPVYLQFVDFHAYDNIGQYVDANALRNNDQVVDALNRLNELINLNVIDQNRVTTERIALTLELENRELSDSERTVLTPIAESNYLIGGDGVINARALLDKEIPMGIGTEEVSYLRRKNPKLNNGTPKYTINEILKWSDIEKEKVDVKVYDIMGKLIFENKLTEWLDKKSNFNIGIVNVSYYLNNQFIGAVKESLIK
jgi:hypothetical protein